MSRYERVITDTYGDIIEVARMGNDLVSVLCTDSTDQAAFEFTFEQVGQLINALHEARQNPSPSSPRESEAGGAS